MRIHLVLFLVVGKALIATEQPSGPTKNKQTRE
jgi:hypothetical protein